MQTCMSKNVVNCNSVTVELPKCHFFRIAIKARKKIVMTPNCSQCAISRLKMKNR